MNFQKMYLYPAAEAELNKHSFSARRPAAAKRTLQTKPDLKFDNVNAYNLYTKIKPWLDYNNNFELIIDGQVIPNSDVTSIINNLTNRSRKSKTPGILELRKELKRRNISAVQIASKWERVVYED